MASWRVFGSLLAARLAADSTYRKVYRLSTVILDRRLWSWFAELGAM